MNRNSLLALATLIALLGIESGDCKRKLQNDHEVDIAKRQQTEIVKMEEVKPDPTCVKLRECESKESKKNMLRYDVMEFGRRVAKCADVPIIKFITHWKDLCGIGRGAGAEMADEDEDEDKDEADEAKSDEVDIAKRQKGLKILKAWKRDEAEMADMDEADEAKSDEAQN